MARPTAIVVLVTALATAAGGVALASVADGSSTVAGAEGTPPASAACAAPAEVQPSPAALPGQTTVSFVVPARAVVRVDPAGRPVAAMTNTRCAPAATDEVVVVDEHGGVRADVVVAVDDVPWTGDWSHAGEWHAWPSGG